MIVAGRRVSFDRLFELEDRAAPGDAFQSLARPEWEPATPAVRRVLDVSSPDKDEKNEPLLISVAPSRDELPSRPIEGRSPTPTVNEEAGAKRGIFGLPRFASASQAFAGRAESSTPDIAPRVTVSSRVSQCLNPIFEATAPSKITIASPQIAERIQDSRRTSQSLSPSDRTSTDRLTYTADGQSIGLTPRDDRIVLPTDDSEAIAGLSFVRQLTDDLAVFEGPGAASRAGGIPVFLNRSSGTDSVALSDVIVALRPGVDAEAFFSNAQFASYRPLWGTPDQFVATLAGRTGRATIEAAGELARDPRVHWCEPDFHQDWSPQYDPNDPLFLNGSQWHIRNGGQNGGVADADVDLDLAWNLTPGGSPNRLIAVTDDGMELTHPDLRIWSNPGEIAGDGIDNEGNGYIDDMNGWNFVSNNNNAGVTTDADRHGTAVAGLAAAKGDNGVGVTGAAYNARVMSVRIFENNKTATNSNVASAVYYAAGRNKSGVGSFASVDVLNASWGGGGYSAALAAAFTYATGSGRGGLGTVAFVATGNDYRPEPMYPSALSRTNPGLIAVGSSNNKDTRADYSRYGAGLDFVAPSNDNRSNYLWMATTDRIGLPGYNFESDYTTPFFGSGFGGTSAATPLAAGIGALVLSQAEAKGVTLTAKQVKDLLNNTTDLLAAPAIVPPAYDPATGTNMEFGHGRINAFTAVDGVGKPELSVLSMTAEVANAASLDMGAAPPGGSETLTLRIRNAGTSDLVLSNLATTGAAFAVDAGFGAGVLKLGEATTFRIRFSPTATGPAAGSLSFTSNDADEGTFTLNLSGTGGASNVSGRLYEDWNGNGARDATDPPLAGRTVFLDANGNGLLDRTSKTVAVGLTIPDNSLTGLGSTVTLAGLTVPVADLTVKVNVDHAYAGDLFFGFQSPSKVTTYLAVGAGDSSTDFTNTVFDDDALLPIQSGVGPFTGSYRPQFNPMSLFDGETPNGDWTLGVADMYGGDVGSLLDWTIEFNAEYSTVTDSQGRYSFGAIPAGSYAVRSVLPEGWSSSGAASAPVVVTGPGDSFANLEFGSAKNNRAYLRGRDDQNANGVFEPTEPGLAGRTLFADANGNGLLDVATISNLKKTATLAIPDNNATGVDSTFTVSGLIGALSDVNVTVNVMHPAVGDLELKLVSPAGTIVPLATRRGANGFSFTGTTFDDAALVPVANLLNHQAPFTGSYRPESPLAALNGQSPNGVWTLKSSDHAANNFGTLLDWSLSLTTGASEISATTNADGAAFLDLPAGANSVRLAPLAGWKFTSPADGKLALNAAGAPIFEQTFGAAEAIAPTVALIAVNDGALQRSLVTSLKVTFSERVTVAPNAFALTGPGGAVPLAVALDDAGPATIATLSSASLADGKYALAVQPGTIADTAQNPLSFSSFNFHRLFGDSNGDGTVDGIDFAAFGGTFGASSANFNYLAYFDFNSDGTLDGLDFAEFGNRFGLTV